MINKKLAFMAIPVLAAVLIGGSLSPAFAALKTTDTNTVTVQNFGIVGSFCGPNLEIGIITTHSVVKIWDNGKALIHLDQEILLIDSVTFATTGSGEEVSNQLVQPGGLPFVFQQNFEFLCTDGSEGFGPAFSVGNTVDENGFVHLHT